jgi:hypothetical protein
MSDSPPAEIKPAPAVKLTQKSKRGRKPCESVPTDPKIARNREGMSFIFSLFLGARTALFPLAC